jgi:hypothetical protein
MGAERLGYLVWSLAEPAPPVGLGVNLFSETLLKLIRNLP